MGGFGSELKIRVRKKNKKQNPNYPQDHKKHHLPIKKTFNTSPHSSFHPPKIHITTGMEFALRKQSSHHQPSHSIMSISSYKRGNRSPLPPAGRAWPHFPRGFLPTIFACPLSPAVLGQPPHPPWPGPHPAPLDSPKRCSSWPPTPGGVGPRWGGVGPGRRLKDSFMVPVLFHYCILHGW